MLRGVIGTVPSRLMEPGQFYMELGYNSSPSLFQCVQTDEPFEDSFRRMALHYTLGGKPDLRWYDLPDHEPVLALGDVHVRIDRTSLSGSAFTTRIGAGSFVLDGQTPIIFAPTGFRGYIGVNINEGRMIPQNFGTNWLAFDRWSLVIDDDGADDEQEVASFDRATMGGETG